MKKMMLMLMMVFAVVTVKAQMVVAAGYDCVYISYDGMTSQKVMRSQLPFGNMIGKGNLQEQIMYYGQRAAEEEYARTGNRMVYQQMLAQYGVYGGVYAGGVYGGYGVTPVTEENMLATMGSGVYVGGTIGNVAVGGDPLMAVARVINFGKSLKKNKTNTTTAPATRTSTRTATAPARTTTRTASNANQKVNQNVVYNASKQRFETAEDLISGF